MILGIGVDIIEVSRIQKAIERWGDAFLEHVFTSEEIDHARTFKFPYAHYAGRFAAKEAVFKALGDKDLGWKDIMIKNDKDGKPLCLCRKTTFQVLLTISHSRDYAVAQAVVTA